MGKKLTVGQWLFVVRRYESYMSAPEHSHATEDGTLYKQIWLEWSEARDADGMMDLLALAEAEGETAVTVPWVVKKRGQLRYAGFRPAEVNAMTLPELAEAIIRNDAPVEVSTTADKTDNETDNEKKTVPRDVENAATSIRTKRTEDRKKGNPRRSLKALIIEAVGEKSYDAMSKQLSRYKDSLPSFD